MKNIFVIGALTCVCGAQAQPNVVIINADDLGYGDVSVNDERCRVQTPNIDRLAYQGIRFTNLHATSATSTPSRYSMLTGVYAWRVEGTGVAPGDAQMIIRPQDATLPKMMQRAGYTTAAIGKWHLGLGSKRAEQDWNGKITPALEDIGFDYSYIMAATADRVPCVYIENGRVANLDPADPIQVSYGAPFDGEPTGKGNPELLFHHPSHGHDQAIVNGVSRIGYMRGGKSALWVDQNIADTITHKAVQFIERNAKSPFFLYFATNDIHVPRVPHPRFVGRSGMGARGDAILEFDWSVGQIMRALDSLGIADNTILIVTSDNGPVLDDGYKDDAVKLVGTHRPAGEFRGGKYGIYEGGTRVLGIMRWPQSGAKGVVCNGAISQVDFFASLAHLVGTEVLPSEAMDSQNRADVLLGRDNRGRQYIIEDAYTRSITAGHWKYIVPNATGMAVAWETGNPTGNQPQPQLFNLKKDIGEQNNVASKYPKKVASLSQILQKEIDK